MSSSAERASLQQFAVSSLAAAVLDGEGTIVSWADTAQRLLGLRSEEVCGRPARTLLADPEDWERLRRERREPGWEGEARLRHADGREVLVGVRAIALRAPGGPGGGSGDGAGDGLGDGTRLYLVLGAEVGLLRLWRQNHSLVEELFAQDRIGLAVFDTDLRVVRTNTALFPYTGLPDALAGARLGDFLAPQDATAIDDMLSKIMRSGEPEVGVTMRVRTLTDPRAGRLLAMSAFRLHSPHGLPMGAAAAFTDVTEHEAAGERLQLLHRATSVLGGSLSITRTCEDLARVLVPALADCVLVGLAEPVLIGDEPVLDRNGQAVLLRTAVAGADPLELPESARVTALPPPGRGRDGGVVLGDLSGRAAGDSAEPGTEPGTEERAPRCWAPPLPGAHSALSAPLRARSAFLGTVTLWRTEQTVPYCEEDLALLEEIAARAALAVDNARRYTREHRAAVSLQRSLLPPSTARNAAVETASVYLPADAGGGVSGDWFDVIPLSSARVGLVVGDVVGHGLQATVTMGRLRTAVRTLADLDLDPEELLSHLDDLVTQLDVATSDEARSTARDSLGATCLYGVYDPVTRRCVFASAGHPPPALVTPGGAEFVEVHPGPPLGVGGLPFEPVEVTVPPGSVLALYTDGLVELRRGDIGAGMAELRDRLVASGVLDHPLTRTAESLVATIPPDSLSDDVTLLLARTRAVPPRDTATWSMAAEPAAVPRARELALEQLSAWDLDMLAFTTELVTSELVTNAVRYGGGDTIELRLTRADTLICEVSDVSSTQPRMRRARLTDEGGRGLYLVAQLTHRWGSRYTRRGKTIWTEQLLTPPLG
ncbi:SpoIIE family protein phosphatase [Streptomyces sp. JJ66]|uniref:SpoIIE family protein phosphatase n=1 Tax=Streptomyces sp. JJ66 TaxID=2803843 RepID=UPI001C5806B6|nr:SpoIIE family protein phosphatase [Streptomyces sp. JJ66]MBW1602289.1 SpoIIE family protein phosphatase [Streptomyces sp. JJ66]